MRLAATLLLATILTLPVTACAQESAKSQKDKGPMSSETFKGLKLRNIGPAFMSGRIADIQIVPDDPATWYVGVGSGGVWKTENAGTTWTPLFDKQPVYSIGSIALDPKDKNTVWVGTGENNGGRHLSFGDGVYKSKDGGKTWKNMGLKTSDHISTMIVHPEDSDTVFVASQGRLWSKGGDRGLYKTTDGGKTWDNILSAGPWTGVTDVVMDPRDPDIIYAATWQHQRTVAAYVGGGPESGIHKSEDGGKTWRKIKAGLPRGNMGKIGLAISPQQPDVIYAAIELDRRTGGVWKSTTRGESWKKMSDAVGGGTGAHYYTELFASPHEFDKIYMVSNTTQISDDGGKTWSDLNNQYKHVDDHAIAFRPDDPDYILFGSDGGLYESYDGTKTWRFINNLPVTQFYKVAVDDTEPFYNVYGGTQDNNSQGGPSRTDNRHGIRNSDWFITLFADGHQSATEPGNPDIMYAEWQEGNLARIDRTTGEVVHIQPQAGKDEGLERFNWDAPIFVSQHDPKRIYFASHRLWRSDNRGDEWTSLSGDLTRNQDKLQLPVQGRRWSWEAGWDFRAMSEYNTITSIGESPIDEDILYVGTDDGLIQVTANGGESWDKIEVRKLPGVPDTAFVNDIRADLYDANTVYVALDNHKYGDYKPYLLKSTNRGKSWVSIAGDLPDKHLVWRIVQDHVDKDLMFTATEFGLFFTVDGGRKWVEFSGGVPTVSFRDVTIQRREEDIVAASFGRGFFILDDYTALRDVDNESLDEDALLFPTRRAWWYIERHPLSFSEGGSQGHSYYRAPNPDFGANFTYYLKEDLLSEREARIKADQKKIKAGQDTPFTGYDAVEAERRETKPQVWLTVRDSDGNIVRRIAGPTKKGIHRIAWDLRMPATQSVSVSDKFDPKNSPSGYLAAPGTYSVELSKRVRGKTTQLAGPQEFTVERLRNGALPGNSQQDTQAFWQRTAKFQRSITAVNATIRSLSGKVTGLRRALIQTPAAPDDMQDQWDAIQKSLYEIEEIIGGNQSKNEVGEELPPNITNRLGKVLTGIGSSTYGPTDTHRRVLGYAEADFDSVNARVSALKADIKAFETALIEAGGPWVPGGDIPLP